VERAIFADGITQQKIEHGTRRVAEFAVTMDAAAACAWRFWRIACPLRARGFGFGDPEVLDMALNRKRSQFRKSPPRAVRSSATW